LRRGACGDDVLAALVARAAHSFSRMNFCAPRA
jgi:hypothetical protein